MATESSPNSSPSSPIPTPISTPTPTATATAITVVTPATTTSADATTPQEASPDPTPPPQAVATTAVRKFPAPCWTQEETMELINAYKDKWYSLRCRNLRSADWDAVAADVNARCPSTTSSAAAQDVSVVGGASVTTAAAGISTGAPKTSAQCRHKMEKLRKRYRTEKQRALTHPNRFFSSSWAFFDLMDAMETGSCLNGGSGSSLGNAKGGFAAVKVVKKGEDESGKKAFHSSGSADQKFRQGLVVPGSSSGNKINPRDLGSGPIKFKFKSHGSSLGYEDAARFDRHLEAEEESYGSGYESVRDYQVKGVSGSRSGGGGGAFFERKFGGRVGGRGDDDGDFYDSRLNSRISNGVSNSGFGKRNRGSKRGIGGGMMATDSDLVPSSSKDPNSVVGEMVRSIRMLGDGFVKMEKMKAEMVREIEGMRMEMEMKRSEMILKSQQLIVNAFVEGLLGGKKKNKKAKLVE